MAHANAWPMTLAATIAARRHRPLRWWGREGVVARRLQGVILYDKTGPLSILLSMMTSWVMQAFGVQISAEAVQSLLFLFVLRFTDFYHVKKYQKIPDNNGCFFYSFLFSLPTAFFQKFFVVITGDGSATFRPITPPLNMIFLFPKAYWASFNDKKGHFSDKFH